MKRACTLAEHMVAHEAGHAFGLEHSGGRDAIMWTGEDFTNLTSCGPHPLDVVAVMSIYQ